MLLERVERSCQRMLNLVNDLLDVSAIEAGRLSLDLEETLIALGMSATSNPAAKVAMQRLKDLSGCEMHLTHIPTPGDEAGLRRLGLNVTSDPAFASRSLFIS